MTLIINKSMNPTAPEGFGSTHLNPKISTYADLVYRTKSLLGWPSAPVEITDEQWAHIIDKAVEDFTEFEGNREEEYLVFCANSYIRSCGVKLDDLLNIGCNSQHCYLTTTTEEVTSVRQNCIDIETSSAFLSVTPFVFPPVYDLTNPNDLTFSGVSGQYFHLFFDSDNPWNATGVCDANCVTINPLNSRWYQLSSNPNLSAITFDFVTNPTLVNVLSSVSYDVQTYGFSNVPMSALGSSVSAIPISYFALSAFYPENLFTTPAVAACLNIGRGKGLIFPNCNTSLISSCVPLSARYSVSPLETSVLTASSRDISQQTHIRLYGVPSCTTDGSIPLDSNDGILGTFTLCNSAFSTNGPISLKKVQFFKDYKPPVEILYSQNCNWENNGFSFSLYNPDYNNCVRTTPVAIPVDVTFQNCNIVTEIGTITKEISSNVDSFINRKRKVLGVFNADTTSQGGYFGGGGDLLFNFDYALMANTFGYDLMGGRNMLGKQGYDLLTYHMARSFVEHSKKMLRYVSYQFNPKTQFLKMTPEPASSTFSGSASCCSGTNGVINPNSTQCYIVGVYLEPPVEHILSSYFIREYVLALAMTTLGRIRNTFGGVTLYGGATLQGADLVAKGEEKQKELLAELRDQLRYSAPPSFYIC